VNTTATGKVGYDEEHPQGYVGAKTIADAINSAYHTVSTANNDDQVVASNLSTEISAGDNITYAAGKNLVVKMDDKDTTTPVVTYGLAKDINVSTITVVDPDDENATPITIGNNEISGLDGTLANAEGATGLDAPTDADETKAATLGDVLNSGWNLKENGGAKDFVKAYDTVNFVDGNGTTANVAMNGDTVANVTFNVKTDGSTVKVDENGNVTAVTTGITPADKTTKPTGKVELADSNAGSSLVNASTVVDAINSAYFSASTLNTDVQVVGSDKTSQISAGDNITYAAGKNLLVKMDNESSTNPVVTYGLAEEIDVKKVTVGDVVIDAATNVISGLADGDISEDSTQAINGSQLYNLISTNSVNTLALSDGVSLPEGKIEVSGIDANATDEEKAAANNKLATVGNVANAINSAFHTVTVANTDVQVEANTGSTQISAGDNITYAAGKNLVVNINKTDTTTPVVTYGLAKDIEVNTATVGSTKLASDAAGNLVIGNSSTGAPVQIKNVAAGTANTDAVNVGQLKGAVNHLNNRINDVKKESRASAAGARAAAALPQVYIPGKSMVAAAAGTFKGQSAVAVGYSRASDNGKLILKLQGDANSQGDVGGAVGLGYQW
ncbi:YadA family autotransporter adhesin, partial [Lonepinella sp. BR2474]|uniref:YadA family autotransporter adhesin n=1 Tax=Lonepinella sp. BR2474 TaxID=3434548 RepID=UPI003F6E299E